MNWGYIFVIPASHLPLKRLPARVYHDLLAEMALFVIEWLLLNLLSGI
jgi:hypothetical protein